VWERIQKTNHFQVKEVWECGKRSGNTAEKLDIFSNYTITLGCYARDSLSFIHLCDVWSCTQEIWVKTHIFKLGYYEKSVGTRSHYTPVRNTDGRPSSKWLQAYACVDNFAFVQRIFVQV